MQFKGNEFICRFNVAKINEGYLEPGAYTLNYITETQTYVAEISNKLLKNKGNKFNQYDKNLEEIKSKEDLSIKKLIKGI